MTKDLDAALLELTGLVMLLEWKVEHLWKHTASKDDTFEIENPFQPPPQNQ